MSDWFDWGRIYRMEEEAIRKTKRYLLKAIKHNHWCYAEELGEILKELLFMKERKDERQGRLNEICKKRWDERGKK